MSPNKDKFGSVDNHCPRTLGSNATAALKAGVLLKARVQLAWKRINRRRGRIILLSPDSRASIMDATYLPSP